MCDKAFTKCTFCFVAKPPASMHKRRVWNSACKARTTCRTVASVCCSWPLPWSTGPACLQPQYLSAALTGDGSGGSSNLKRTEGAAGSGPFIFDPHAAKRKAASAAAAAQAAIPEWVRWRTHIATQTNSCQYRCQQESVSAPQMHHNPMTQAHHTQKAQIASTVASTRVFQPVEREPAKRRCHAHVPKLV